MISAGRIAGDTEQRLLSGHDRRTRRRLLLRGGPLPPRVRADVRPLLPLPQQTRICLVYVVAVPSRSEENPG